MKPGIERQETCVTSSCRRWRLTQQPVGLQEVVQQAVAHVSVQEVVVAEQGTERPLLAAVKLTEAKRRS